VIDWGVTSPGAGAADFPVVVDIDPHRRILWVRFRGLMHPGNACAGIDRVLQHLPQLGAGFVLVSDLSELEHMEIDCFREVTRMMDACFAAGLTKVIRIVPDPRKDIGFQLLALVHYHGQIPIVVCASRAEAEQALGP
jgi:hypothetical protein